jgi:hypothetical protein
LALFGCENHDVKDTHHYKRQEYYFFPRQSFAKQKVAQHNAAHRRKIVDNADDCNLNPLRSHKVDDVGDSALY